MGEATTYTRRRAEIRTYFDRTAVENWKRFAGDTPLGRIRESVREGRARMRAAMLDALPADLAGWRVLDAGCGAGAMAAELGLRGADVLGVDLSPEIVRFAADSLPRDLGLGRVTFRSGDMLDADLGRFDAVVAMDSLIHYAEDDAVAALAGLAARTRSRIVFTFAPQTPALGLMHALGRFFPRSNRAPRIVPIRPAALRARLAAEPAFADWRIERTLRVAHGFYTSEMIALVRR